MTNNFIRDVDPAGPWASAAQSLGGEFGVAIGYGRSVLAFILEAEVDWFITNCLIANGADDEHVTLVREAAKSLAAFKATAARIAASANN